MARKTVRDLIVAQMKEHGDSLDRIISTSPPDLDLDYEFDHGFGSPECPCFIIWTLERVYFPHDYDGADYVLSAPRNPCMEFLGTYADWKDYRNQEEI